jgi:alpha-glucuronidase
MRLHACDLALVTLCLSTAAQAETDYDLWLRYQPVEAHYKSHYGVSHLVTGASSPTLDAARANTYAYGPGSTIARITDGSLDKCAMSAVAGATNIGNDADWSGSIFNQANWYVFGRMAWDTKISARAVAQEWGRLTFTADVTELSLGRVCSGHCCCGHGFNRDA